MELSHALIEAITADVKLAQVLAERPSRPGANAVDLVGERVKLNMGLLAQLAEQGGGA